MSQQPSLRQKIRSLKIQALAVYFAARHPEMPFAVRLLAFVVAAYAFSPIDLIPDFIPVLGLLDDLILVPAGIALVLWLTPDEIMVAAHAKAEQAASRPVSYAAAVAVVLVWLFLSGLAWRFFVAP